MVVDPVAPVAPVTGGNGGTTEPGVIETGLNGFAGCSIEGKGSEAALPALAMISLFMLALRRRMNKPVKAIKNRFDC